MPGLRVSSASAESGGYAVAYESASFLTKGILVTLSTTLILKKRRTNFHLHYTIFSATERERLHGHNYFVSARIVAKMGNNGFSADYNVYKRRIKALCDKYDEYMLLPEFSPLSNA